MSAINAQIDLEEAINSKKIALLNDTLRTTFFAATGKIVFTTGVQSFRETNPKGFEELITKVREFKDFTFDNDPHGEHDFGKVEVDGKDFFWKIDYYDKSMDYGSEDPTDPKVTTRVLTILFADEY